MRSRACEDVRVSHNARNALLSSFRDAPLGAGPESILPIGVVDSVRAEPVIGPRFARTRWRALRCAIAHRAMTTRNGAQAAHLSPRAPVAGVLGHVAVPGLLADVVFFVVAMAPGGVDGNLGRAAGPLVTPVVLWNRLDGFLPGHHQPPSPLRKRRARCCGSGTTGTPVIASQRVARTRAR